MNQAKGAAGNSAPKATCATHMQVEKACRLLYKIIAAAKKEGKECLQYIRPSQISSLPAYIKINFSIRSNGLARMTIRNDTQ